MAELVTLVCWGAVVVVWVVGAALGARKSRARRQAGFGSGAFWRIGSVIAAVLVYRLGRSELHRVTDHALWIQVVGLVVLIASTAFTIWARFALGRFWSASPNALRAGHELKTDGPYSITRHPIYTGLFGMVLGSVLLNGLGSSLAFLLIAAIVVATRIPIEEHLMDKTFPDEYARYRQRVPQFVPGLKLLRRLH
jgi:protein-S-isoprenylcysteine O-methyltransferase Ste14